MPRARKSVPSYLRHKQTGRARVLWTDPTGQRRERILPGAYNSKESRQAYANLLLEIAATPTATVNRDGLTIAELLLAFRKHAEQHYRHPDGKPTSSMAHFNVVIRALRKMYDSLPVAEFGPVKLKAIRQSWVDAGLTRTECNRRTGAIKQIFRWGTSEELVPTGIYHGLQSVSPLARGRTTAPECDPVGPVDDEIVERTLPYLNRYVVGMVKLQRLTGMRPGEVCSIRRADLDTGGAVWLYRPAQHKNTWRGKERTIPIGPRAQELLKQFFTPALEEYLFSPARAMIEVRAERSAQRVTPKWASHLERNVRKRKAEPKRTPKEKYDRTSYARAIARACEDHGIPHWHPNQLRHSYATEVRKRHGLEAASILLGHSELDTTTIYAERNHAAAVSIAAEIG